MNSRRGRTCFRELPEALSSSGFYQRKGAVGEAKDALPASHLDKGFVNALKLVITRRAASTEHICLVYILTEQSGSEGVMEILISSHTWVPHDEA
mmetsp:Transcript_34758/g.137058  ORF Transcript_34758/g.137058 Transcript_34758/m.137058 type:complete len:95 (-) Transcript_34758:385-669(-)